jgi:predicted Zn-ribbon and HTH transcriptional regulator
MKMRRLMVSVVHRDLDAVEDGERRHGWELMMRPAACTTFLGIRAGTSTLVP